MRSLHSPGLILESFWAPRDLPKVQGEDTMASAPSAETAAPPAAAGPPAMPQPTQDIVHWPLRTRPRWLSVRSATIALANMEASATAAGQPKWLWRGTWAAGRRCSRHRISAPFFARWPSAVKLTAELDGRLYEGCFGRRHCPKPRGRAQNDGGGEILSQGKHTSNRSLDGLPRCRYPWTPMPASECWGGWSADLSSAAGQRQLGSMSMGSATPSCIDNGWEKKNALACLWCEWYIWKEIELIWNLFLQKKHYFGRMK